MAAANPTERKYNFILNCGMHRLFVMIILLSSLLFLFYHKVIIDGKLLKLTHTEFELLYSMASHCNQVFSKQQLSRQIGGMN